MTRLAAATVCAVLMLSWAGGQDEDEDSCYGCHLELDPPFSSPAEIFDTDIHAQEGLSCAGCHGGDSQAWDYDEAKDPATGFIGKPEGRAIIDMCAGCHSDPGAMRRYNPNLPTDQEIKYWTSGHGQALAAGNRTAAQCSSCHGTHGIKRIGDPGSKVYPPNVATTCAQCHADADLMAPAELPHDIVEMYVGSVHGAAIDRGDLAAPTCNTCHGNHGAAPPDIGSIQDVCGLCHPNNQRLFNETRMRKMFTGKGLHGCAVCHTAHDIQKVSEAMVGMGPGRVCSGCHELGDPGAIQAVQISTVLDSLNGALAQAREGLDAAETRGLGVEGIYADLQSAQTALIQSRTQVHTFDAVAVRAEAQPGFINAAAAVVEANRLLEDFRRRKVGLGIATILITFLVVTLFLYIRTMDDA
ncbi:MAG: cytochrome c3 family protein [Candidatus Neomarinimicrobiota bacterium]